MAKQINSREALFVAHYTSPESDTFDNATLSAKRAGYSIKSAACIAAQLLKKPKLQLEINRIRSQHIEPLTRETFVKNALKDYESTPLIESNRPRFLELAGKGAGILGNNEAKSGQTLNLTQINITGSENKNELWEMTRKLLGNE